MVGKVEITYTVGMFHATLNLLVETPEQPFISLYTLEYSQPFLKIVSYQGFVDKHDEIQEATHLSLTLAKTAKEYKEKLNVAVVEEPLLKEDTEKSIEGEEEESDGTEFVDSIFLDEEDSSDTIEPESHKDKPKEINDDDDEAKDDKKDDNDDDDDHDDHPLIKTRRTCSLKVRTKKMQTPILSPPRSPRKDLSLDKAITKELIVFVTPTPATLSQKRIKEKVDEVLYDIVPKIALNATNNLIEDNLPRTMANVVKKIIKELFRIYRHNTVLNVHHITGASTTTITSDIQEQMDDAFFKRDHVDHQGDDALPKKEKSMKKQKTSKSSKYARGSSLKQLVKDTNTSTSGEQKQQQDWDAWKDTWHKRMYKINHKKVRTDPEEYFFDYKIVKVVRVITKQQHVLDFMEQIIVMRENDKPSSFFEADFKYLNKNDILDMYYLCLNKKVNYHENKLLNSHLTFIRSCVIWERVHDFQLGIESYNIKINLTTLTSIFPVIEACNPYSIVDKPTTGLIYLNIKEDKRVMDLIDIVKFCDATLEKVVKEAKMKIFEI
nr:hypothetical protein [Tanacetum cinerariifolium]